MAESAGTLNCLMCGAAARTDATQCEHCGAKLATVACPSCFGMIFQGSRFCNHCGAAVHLRETAASGLPCPHCETELKFIRLGKIELGECDSCDGLWLENSEFETLCSDREQQAAVLGPAVPDPAPSGPLPVKYVKCPVCSVIMHRQNFSGASGVVIDICKPHGVWFDATELQRIISFIRGGGMDRARDKQKRELEEARRRLEQARTGQIDYQEYYRPTKESVTGDIVFAVAEVAWWLLTRRRR